MLDFLIFCDYMEEKGFVVDRETFFQEYVFAKKMLNDSYGNGYAYGIGDGDGAGPDEEYEIFFFDVADYNSFTCSKFRNGDGLGCGQINILDIF